LPKTSAAVGDGNFEAIMRSAESSALVMCAWGANQRIDWRAAFVRAKLVECGICPHHLGLTKDGHPRHPLYLKGDSVPVMWRA
jgi:hypothetical protein